MYIRIVLRFHKIKEDQETRKKIIFLKRKEPDRLKWTFRLEETKKLLVQSDKSNMCLKMFHGHCVLSCKTRYQLLRSI